ncbi:MAG: flippase-like domain-containing protein [Candidatus Omnitrophica bacterium]|nr:flippase-like domain-containing protein [Candidatus Omnitrophota bacterium]
MKDKIFFLIRVAIGVGLIVVLFRFIGDDRILRIFSNSNKIYLFFGFVIFFIANCIGMLRWRFLLIASGLKVSIGESFLAFFCGLFFNLFFPSFVAGDVFRGATISHRHGELKKVASSVFMDRFSGSVALAIVALVSYLVGGTKLNEPQVLHSLILVLLVIGCASLLVFNRSLFRFLTGVLKRKPSWREKVISFHDQLYLFKEKPKNLFLAVVISLPIHILVCIAFFINSRAFGSELPISNFFIVIPIITAISLIPVTIAGAGTREAAAVYFFVLLGGDAAVALGISLLNLVAITIVGAMGGVLYLCLFRSRLQSKRLL